VPPQQAGGARNTATAAASRIEAGRSGAKELFFAETKVSVYVTVRRLDESNVESRFLPSALPRPR
jgi:hypothetical protein